MRGQPQAAVEMLIYEKLFTYGVTIDVFVGEFPVYLSNFSSKHVSNLGLSVGFGHHIITLGFYEIVNFGKVRDEPWHMPTPMSWTALTSTDVLGRSADLRRRVDNNQNPKFVLLSSNLSWRTIQIRCHMRWCLANRVVCQRLCGGTILL